ncbi:CoA transferase [Litoreibacter roseus]|uniref:CoA transferase n=1 Tax=Litoreibacter roseus TaxID=2601869 RepID=A0A6N6JE43_9RHOB|nr:CoA transferase [Litoreibacter roseus]
MIDWTHVLAGPACSYFLGQLGAEVIKIEHPGHGDAMRHRGGTDKARAAQGMSTAYLTQGAGKTSIAVDLGRPRGREVFERLLKSADVLVENHRPSTLDRLNLSEAQTRAINPQLIHCAMTGYGRANDMADVPAYDINIQAICGLMDLTGTADTGPIRTGAPIIDYATALSGAFAVTAALYQRAQTGEGAFVDVSMLETALTLMSSTVTDFRLTGTVPKPRGNAANSRSPAAGTFACRTGHISLGVNEERQFVALAEALGQANWLRDPRFAERVARDENAAALGDEIAAVLVTRDAEEWEPRLSHHGVPAARLRSLPEALDLPPVHQRGYLSDAPDTTGAALPFEIDGTREIAAGPSPALGADTVAILRDLGYDTSEIEALGEDGAVDRVEPATVG